MGGPRKQSTPSRPSSEAASSSTGPIGPGSSSPSTSTVSTPLVSGPKIELPRIIHFIWAGGEKLMGPKELKTVVHWAVVNSDFQVYLWIDTATWPSSANKSIYQKYQEFFKDKSIVKEYKIKVYEENCDDVKTEEENAPIILKDIKELRDEHVSYEIDKLTPNYGSSSDLLRYDILYRYGGAYFDSDVGPGKSDDLGSVHIYETEEEREDDQVDKHVLYVDHRPQEPNPSPEQLGGPIETVGNDSFFCTKKNPIMLKILQTARQNYSELSEIEDKDQQTYRRAELAHSGKNIRNVTIGRTGPHMVLEALSKNPKGLKGLEDDKQIKKMRGGKGFLNLTAPQENSKNWLDAKLKEAPPRPLKTALNTIEKTIEYELKYFQFVRLDDHITDLMVSYNKNFPEKKMTADAALNHLKEIIKKKNQTQIKYVQVTGKYPESIEYCEREKHMTFLDLKDPIEVIRTIGAYLPWAGNFVGGLEVQVINKEKINDHEKVVERVAEMFQQLSSANPKEAKEYAKSLQEYITNLPQVLALVSRIKDEKVKEKVQQIFLGRLQACKRYATELNKGLTSSNKVVDVELIEGLMEALKTKNKPPGDKKNCMLQ